MFDRVSVSVKVAPLGHHWRLSVVRNDRSAVSIKHFYRAMHYVHSAVLRLCGVCLSVCPSVTLVDCDHIGWKSWKLIARTVSPTPSLFGSKNAIHLLPGEHGEIFGETRGGVGKSGALAHKNGNRPISQTRTDRGKVIM